MTYYCQEAKSDVMFFSSGEKSLPKDFLTSGLNNGNQIEKSVKRPFKAPLDHSFNS